MLYYMSVGLFFLLCTSFSEINVFFMCNKIIQEFALVLLIYEEKSIVLCVCRENSAYYFGRIDLASVVVIFVVVVVAGSLSCFDFELVLWSFCNAF